MAKKITSKEIIDKVSILYREELRKLDVILRELEEVYAELEEHERNGGMNITVADYKNLKRLHDILEQNKKLQEKYCDGIDMTREILMDLLFDKGGSKCLKQSSRFMISYHEL